MGRDNKHLFSLTSLGNSSFIKSLAYPGSTVFFLSWMIVACLIVPYTEAVLYPRSPPSPFSEIFLVLLYCYILLGEGRVASMTRTAYGMEDVDAP